METQTKLRKKSFTVVEQAIHQVRGFRNLYQELDDKIRLSGQSPSTLKNYARKLAQLMDIVTIKELLGHERIETTLVYLHVARPNRSNLSALQRCRTSSMGGHVDKCDQCGHIRISYNSCRNRHCPKCQNAQREAWVESRKQDLLPVPYFHVVFTVPDKLNSLFLHHPVMLYNLLFAGTWETIAQFSYSGQNSLPGCRSNCHKKSCS